MATWTERLRPRSTEGDVYRDEWVEQFELILDGAGILIAFLSALRFVAGGEWLAAAGFLTILAAMIVAARFVFFRPHLVVGDTVLVLAGVLRTRRIPVAEVRKAVASKGALKLTLTDGDEVHVPGHFLWIHARGDCYAYLAQTINARIASPTIAPDAGADA
ncbi:MAG: hypothetical protein IPP16_15950 [Acidimicrobiaceae bacterium]|nr:hypothetical protein [Acidimicrobiaceae bacterium]